jgi:DNA-directed RNA polymerase subunit beta
MGSNMQRQAVPPLTLEHPIVGTGLEGRVVGESGHVLEAQTTGRISYVSGRMILVQRRERGVERQPGHRGSNHECRPLLGEQHPLI